MAQGRTMTKVEIQIEKWRIEEGNCRNEAYALEQKAAILRAKEMVYRSAWQDLESAHKADEGSANEG